MRSTTRQSEYGQVQKGFGVVSLIETKDMHFVQALFLVDMGDVECFGVNVEASNLIIEDVWKSYPAGMGITEKFKLRRFFRVVVAKIYCNTRFEPGLFQLDIEVLGLIHVGKYEKVIYGYWANPGQDFNLGMFGR